MNLIIVGCGRVGSELARSTQARGHQVTVIDHSLESFVRLNVGETSFHGRTIHGDVLHQDVLQRAGIAQADGLAAVTSDDLTNFVTARIASQLFQIPNVVARVYDPQHLKEYEAFGIQTVTSSTWASQRVEQLLIHPGIAPLSMLGHSEVLIIEVTIQPHLAGQDIQQLSSPGKFHPIALVRAGRASLITPSTTFENDDLAILAVASSALPYLEELVRGEKA